MIKPFKQKLRKWLGPIFILAIGLGIFIILNIAYNGRQKPKEGSSNSQKGSDKTHMENVEKQPTTVETRSNISFSNYKEIYKNYELEHSINKSNQKKGETAGVEFVFLWKDNNSITPFPLQGFVMRKKDDSKGGEDEISYYRAKHEGTIRFLITIGEGKYQGNFNDNVQPGTLYILQELSKKGDTKRLKRSGYREYWYPIRIPDREKLTFVDEFEDIKDEAYKVPIFVNKVIQTDYRKGLKKQLGKRTVSHETKNVSINGVKQLSGNEWRTEVQYLYNGNKYIAKEDDQIGKWTVELKKKKSNELNGSVVVYRKFVDDYYEDKRNVSDSELLHMGAKELYPTLLLKYRRSVQGSHINMEKSLNFNKEKRKWVESTIDVGKYIKKRFENRYDQKLRSISTHKVINASVSLSVPDPNQVDSDQKQQRMDRFEPAIVVCSRLPYWENGRLKATLKAPEGVYNLIFNKEILIKNIKWPPDPN